MPRPDLQAGFAEVKNIPGKGAGTAKALSGQAAGRRGSGSEGSSEGAEARKRSSPCCVGRVPSLGMQLGLPRNRRENKSRDFWGAFTR